MKKHIIHILAFCISSISFASQLNATEFKPIGGVLQLKKTPSTKLYFSCYDEGCKHTVFVLEEDGKTKESNIIQLPTATDTDSYQDKWGTLLSLATNTSLTMPPWPEFRYLYLVNQCQKTLLREFHFMDDAKNLGKTNTIKKLYLNHLLTNLGI